MFIYQKKVDRSTLRQGFQIPVEFHELLKVIPNGIPVHGETRHIKIIINGEEFDAQLKNQGFDRNKYAGHTDVIQVRYGENTPISKKLREIFYSTWKYVEEVKNQPENLNRKFEIKIPEEQQEFIALSATNFPNVFMVDCITRASRLEIGREISTVSELDFETLELREDQNASIKEVNRLQKVRILDRSIGDSLKQIYDFHCQMTGERIGESYESMVVEAHHIIPFTISMNNDTSNIIILSPNYHRIIHKAKPEFNREKLAFVFPNGLVDKIRLNKHL